MKAIVGIIEFIHVVAAIFWVGGAVFFDIAVAPLGKGAALPNQKSIGEFILPRAGRFFAITGGTTMLFGILRGIVGGEIDSISALGTPYGIVWLVSLVLSIGMAVYGGRVVATRATKLYTDPGLWTLESDGSPSAALRAAHKSLASAARFESIAFLVIILGMVAMAHWL